jgi:hypothetical protein
MSAGFANKVNPCNWRHSVILPENSIVKLCMQAFLRCQGRTEVAIGPNAKSPEAKARKVRISLVSHSQHEGLLADVTEFICRL